MEDCQRLRRRRDGAVHGRQSKRRDGRPERNAPSTPTWSSTQTARTQAVCRKRSLARGSAWPPTLKRRGRSRVAVILNERGNAAPGLKKELGHMLRGCAGIGLLTEAIADRGVWQSRRCGRRQHLPRGGRGRRALRKRPRGKLTAAARRSARQRRRGHAGERSASPTPLFPDQQRGRRRGERPSLVRRRDRASTARSLCISHYVIVPVRSKGKHRPGGEKDADRAAIHPSTLHAASRNQNKIARYPPRGSRTCSLPALAVVPVVVGTLPKSASLLPEYLRV